jgi:hypothetical protein
VDGAGDEDAAAAVDDEGAVVVGDGGIGGGGREGERHEGGEQQAAGGGDEEGRRHGLPSWGRTPLRRKKPRAFLVELCRCCKALGEMNERAWAVNCASWSGAALWQSAAVEAMGRAWGRGVLRFNRGWQLAMAPRAYKTSLLLPFAVLLKLFLTVSVMMFFCFAAPCFWMVSAFRAATRTAV